MLKKAKYKLSCIALKLPAGPRLDVFLPSPLLLSRQIGSGYKRSAHLRLPGGWMPSEYWNVNEIYHAIKQEVSICSRLLL